MAETSQNHSKFLTLEIKQESSDFFFLSNFMWEKVINCVPLSRLINSLTSSDLCNLISSAKFFLWVEENA